MIALQIPHLHRFETIILQKQNALKNIDKACVKVTMPIQYELRRLIHHMYTNASKFNAQIADFRRISTANYKIDIICYHLEV